MCSHFTEPRGMSIVLLCAQGCLIALQAPSSVGGAVKCAQERQAFPIVCFCLSIVLLLASKMAEHGHNQGDTKGHSQRSSGSQGFFVQHDGSGKVSLHPCQFSKITQGNASQV